MHTYIHNQLLFVVEYISIIKIQKLTVFAIKKKRDIDLYMTGG